MATIPLTQGQYAVVDAEDVTWIRQWKWCITRYGYASRSTTKAERLAGTPATVLLHRALLNAPAGIEVDHINHVPLDNRRCNLRLATRTENQWNRRAQRHSLSGYRGVQWDKKTGRWTALIDMGVATLRLGWFDDVMEAAYAYDQAARRLHGEFAMLNNVPSRDERIERVIAILEAQLEEVRVMRARAKNF